MAFVTFLFRQRFAALGALMLVALIAAFLVFHRHAVPVGALFLSAVSFGVAFAVGFVHLRHVAFAAASVAAPLPGLIAAGPFAIAEGLGMSSLLAIYGFAAVVAALQSALILRSVAADRERAEAALVSPAPLVLPVTVAVPVACVVAAGWLFPAAGSLAMGASLELVAGVFSTVMFVAAAALVLPFSEAAVTDANRAQERWERRLRLVTRVAEPRWGMSLGGIVLVFATLGYFGAGPLLATSALLARPMLWAVSALLVFVAAFAVGRDWREALAAVLALTAETMLCLWLWGRAVGHLTATALLEIAVADAASLLLMLVLLAWARRYRNAGDAPGVARVKALEDCAVPAFYGCGGAAAAIAPWIVLHGSMATLAMLFALAGAASVLGAPAIATALEFFVRRRVSVDSLYGRR